MYKSTNKERFIVKNFITIILAILAIACSETHYVNTCNDDTVQQDFDGSTDGNIGKDISINVDIGQAEEVEKETGEEIEEEVEETTIQGPCDEDQKVFENKIFRFCYPSSGVVLKENGSLVFAGYDVPADLPFYNGTIEVMPTEGMAVDEYVETLGGDIKGVFINGKNTHGVNFVTASGGASSKGLAFVDGKGWGNIFVTFTAHSMDGAGAFESQTSAFFDVVKNTFLFLCEEGLDNDCDGIDNEEDNCPENYNPNQKDVNDDGVGDICDSSCLFDSDCDDGIENTLDVCNNNTKECQHVELDIYIPCDSSMDCVPHPDTGHYQGFCLENGTYLLKAEEACVQGFCWLEPDWDCESCTSYENDDKQYAYCND